MTRAYATIAVPLALMLALEVPASAGPPKSQSVASVAVTSGHRVIATIVAGQDRFDVALAQIASSMSLRTGRGCRPHASRRALTVLASSLQLDVAARVASDGATSYVYGAEGDSSYDSPARSFNYVLVMRGLATVNREHGQYRARFLKAQRAAKGAHRGLWTCRR
jgi:hypothetical protein